MNNSAHFVVYIILTCICAFLYLGSEKEKSGFKEKIKSLEHKNDSILAGIKVTQNIIHQLDSNVKIYKLQIEKNKQALSALKAKDERNKKQHNEETNRINTLSKSALISEFTNTFK